MSRPRRLAHQLVDLIGDEIASVDYDNVPQPAVPITFMTIPDPLDLVTIAT